MLNKKLTPIIAGRTIKRVKAEANALHVEFADGSTLKAKVSAAPADEFDGKEVKAVRQKSTSFSFDFTDGSSADVSLAEETSSVMLRDKDGVMEYAD